MKVLVIEDDRTVGQFVKRGLEEQFNQVDLVDDGVVALQRASASEYDVLVLDLRLPGLSGIEVLTGADDYVTKPFAFEELLARVEALCRRPKDIAYPTLKIVDLEIDTSLHEVHRSGVLIDLTPKEYSVLEYLVRNSGRVMTRTLITEYAWDYHFDPGTNVVDVLINRLRKKMDQGFEPKLIHTVRGVGYVLKA